jgi:hypothetical protein
VSNAIPDRRSATLRVAGALCAGVVAITAAGCGPHVHPPGSTSGGISQPAVAPASNPGAADPSQTTPPVAVPPEPPQYQQAPAAPVQVDPPPVEVQPCTPLLDGDGNSTSSC